MAHLSGTARSQLLLLPEAVDDYVGPDNPVRFIEAFVDGVDLGAAGFVRVQPKTAGRPDYDLADLLKLYIYGYLNRIRSSRRLEAETHRNGAVSSARFVRARTRGGRRHAHQGGQQQDPKLHPDIAR